MDKKSEYNIIVKDTVTSTNSVLKEMAKDGCRKLSDPRQGKARKELLFAARQRSLYKLAFAV